MAANSTNKRNKTNTGKTGLTLQERVMIPLILKKENDYPSMVVCRDLKNKVMLSQQELKDFEVSSTATGLRWNEKGTKSIVYYDLTDFERKAIKEGLKEFNEKKKINESLLSLYEKFIKP